MLIGATVLCLLVLLVLFADRLGASVWHGGGGQSYFRCEACDLRYQRRELHNHYLQVCPQGHQVIEEQAAVTAGMVGIFACFGFLAVALLLLATGVVSPP